MPDQYFAKTYKDGKQYIRDNYKTHTIPELQQATGLTRHYVIDICKAIGVVPKAGRADRKRGIEIKEPKEPAYSKYQPDTPKKTVRHPAKYSNEDYSRKYLD